MKPSDLTDKMRAMLPPDVKRELGAAGKTLAELTSKRDDKLEGDIHKRIMQYLGSKGIKYRRDRMDKKTTGTVGWPDFTFAWKGSFCGIPIAYPVAVEVKRPGNDSTQEQVDVQLALIADGWQVFVVHSFEELVEQLKRLR